MDIDGWRQTVTLTYLQRTTIVMVMALKSDLRSGALQRWHVKEKKEIFFLLFRVFFSF
jgi:hypothetical protein